MVISSKTATTLTTNSVFSSKRKQYDVGQRVHMSTNSLFSCVMEKNSVGPNCMNVREIICAGNDGNNG